MNRERGPLSLFHAATERDKEEAAKQHHIEMIAKGQINIFEVNQKREGFNLLEQAVAKLKAEMAANEKNSYIQGVGQHLIDYVTANPSAAPKIAEEKKSIKGSYDAMEKLAKSAKGTGTVMFMPQEGFEIIMKYFGIDGAVMNGQQSTQAPAPASNKTIDEPQAVDSTPKTKPRFEASFDEFL